MNIYASRYSNPLIPFAGDDLWVRVYYYEGCTQFYIQILNIDEDCGIYTFHRVAAYDVDHCLTYDPRSLNTVFNREYTEYFEYIHLVQPIEVRTTDEIISALHGNS